MAELAAGDGPWLVVGWATPARRTPATGTTSAPWSSRSSRPAWASRCRGTGPGRASRRHASCGWAAARGTRGAGRSQRPHERLRRPGGLRRPLLQIDPARLLVVHDELDLPFANLMLKRGEGRAQRAASVSQSLGTKDYCRLRIGIGRPPGRIDRRLRAARLLRRRAQGTALRARGRRGRGDAHRPRGLGSARRSASTASGGPGRSGDPRGGGRRRRRMAPRRAIARAPSRTVRPNRRRRRAAPRRGNGVAPAGVAPDGQRPGCSCGGGRSLVGERRGGVRRPARDCRTHTLELGT